MAVVHYGRYITFQLAAVAFLKSRETRLSTCATRTAFRADHPLAVVNLAVRLPDRIAFRLEPVTETYPLPSG